jgi:hypothetical protein
LFNGIEGLTMAIDKARAAVHLKAFDFTKLFIEELGWDRPGSRQVETIEANGQQFTLTPIADKRGVRIFRCNDIPERNTRQRIEREITKRVYEHLIIFTDTGSAKQIWQWVAREKGKPAAFREHMWLASSAPDALIQKLDHIAFTLNEEEGLTLTGTTLRMRDAFDREKITKRFYEDFKKQHDRFLTFIDGLASVSDQQWYASLMLNRLMFVYFIQKKRFLDGDIDYLRHRLAQVRAARGTDQFHSFYRAFLLKLFHGGLATAVDARDPETAALLGSIPYLNGGLFEPHALEAEGHCIQIADAAFEGVFAFFDQYEWTLDTRPIEEADGKEINPDVLGHIFEKYINQKQMGAYYTKEDITDYITKNTVVPWLFQNAITHDRVAFEPGGYVWRLLSENPDAYIYNSVRHGTEQALPENIAAGIKDVAKRTDWNKTAPTEFGLPTEIWREVVSRRERYAAVRAKAESGEITRIEDFISLNLDIRQFARDAIQYAESPDLVRAFWRGISSIKILDPACGSGAFLFAALNIQYDLYDACLERMEQFVASAPDSGGGRAQVFSDFRAVLAQVAQHPNRDYFIYKSIIIANLYGVDIMDEAVEICKLRLFLKLASQLENPDQIEPLPDIDFNIRAGNTLIGYTSIADVKKVTEVAGLFSIDPAKEIEEAAQDLDQAFRLFREQQTRLHGGIEAAHKAELRRRLTELEVQLDRFLAKDYGVEAGEGLAASANFLAWKEGHKPFHWLIEFYGIIRDGGFDVVVANPPYVDLKSFNDYKIVGYETRPTNNLYAPFFELTARIIGNHGLYGFIVPISSTSTEGYATLQEVIFKRDCFVACFDDRPAHLFDDLDKNTLSIIVSKNAEDQPRHFSTRLMRWNSVERDALIESLEFEESSVGIIPATLPKIGNRTSYGVWEKIFSIPDRLGLGLSRNGGNETLYSRKINSFVQVLNFVPKVLDGSGNLRPPSEFKSLKFETKGESDAILCLMNSSLFRWYLDVTADGSHLNKREVINFPVNAKLLSNKHPKLLQLADDLAESLKINSFDRTMRYKHDTLTVQCIVPKHSKRVIDQIDDILGEYFGFSESETDFIKNHDIKYRMGAEEEDAD